jgi:hypothetical protein
MPIFIGRRTHVALARVLIVELWWAQVLEDSCSEERRAQHGASHWQS